MHTKETEKRRPGKRRGGRYKVLLIASLCTFAVLSSSLTGTVLMRRHEAANAAELAELYSRTMSFISTTISAESTAASARFSPTRETPTGSTRHI